MKPVRNRFYWLLVLLPALALGAINALKPVHIDDAIYLRYAQQIVQHPADPYGFEMFWFQWPENANWVLSPIVTPYWIAAGMAIFGENILLLKLWMTPFAALLMFALDALLRRGDVTHRFAILWMIALSPAVLPGFNLMLDVPVIALSISSLVLFLRSMERRSTSMALFAGALCGVAILTKWTAFLFPPLFVFAAWRMRDWMKGALACAMAMLVVVLWEGYIAMRYGQSHLLFHVLVGDSNRAGGKMDVVRGFLPLLGAAGSLALPMMMSRWRGGAMVGLMIASIAWAISPTISLPWLPFAIVGVGILGLIGADAKDAVSGKHRLRMGGAPMPLVIVVWLLLEIIGYFMLSPFPAMRRMMGLQIALVLFVAMVCPNLSRRCVWTSAILSILLGLSVNTIDILDARAIRSAAVQSIKWASKTYPDANVYASGHWGFGWYARVSGAPPVVPDVTRLRAGDVLLMNSVTTGPDLLLPSERPDKTLLVDDAIPLSALPYHRYSVPLLWRNAPRVQVGVFRVRSDGRIYTNLSPAELTPELARRAPYLSDGALCALIAAMQFGEPAIQRQASDLILTTGERGILLAMYHEDPRVRLWAVGQKLASPKIRERLILLANEDPEESVRTAARARLEKGR